MSKMLALALLATGLSSGLALASEVTIGRWCDQMALGKREMAIRVTDQGQAVAFSRFYGGSTLSAPLAENAGNIFAVIDSPSGDQYRVVPATGDLQLIDNDGLIRTATRLENEPQPGECLP
jgi:hypothetical protein